MRLLILAAAAGLLSLAACADPGGHVASAADTAAVVADATVATKPVDVANTTTLDERVATGAEVSYTAASRLGTALATAGLIDKTRFKALDNQAYSALLAVRAAYRSGNATSYVAAVDQVNLAVTAINSLVK